jgi:mitochondrial fission protein ELM1
LLLSARPVNALLLSDGKPGHYHQSEGVIAALGRLGPVATSRLEVRRRFVVPTRTLLQLVNAGARPAHVLRLGYGVRAAELPPTDVVVSAGGETLAANAAAAKALGAANIFCGRLRRLAPEHVALVLVTLDSLAEHPNHLVCLPPSPIDAAPRTRTGGGRLGRDHPPARVGVLIGGNSGAFRYRPEDWLRLTGFLREAHRSHGIAWLATTSRRSGAFIGDALAAMASEADSSVRTFIDFRTAGPGTLARIFAEADAILCTDDSTSMLSEAIGACLPVVAVAPEACALEPREAEYRRLLAERGWYRPLRLAELTPAAFLAALEEIAPRTTSARDELAAAIGERLPMLEGGQTPRREGSTKAAPSGRGV